MRNEMFLQPTLMLRNARGACLEASGHILRDRPLRALPQDKAEFFSSLLDLAADPLEQEFEDDDADSSAEHAEHDVSGAIGVVLAVVVQT